MIPGSAVGMEGGATEGTKIKESRGRKPAFSGNGNEQSVAQIIIKFVRAHLRDLRKNKWVFRCILECDAKADVALLMKSPALGFICWHKIQASRKAVCAFSFVSWLPRLAT